MLRTAARVTRYALLTALLVFVADTGRPAVGEEEGSEAKGAFQNPYFERAAWKVWRDDDMPVEGLLNMVREGKKKKQVQLTLKPPAKEGRIYPVAKKPGAEPAIVFEKRGTPSKTFAGMWDDAYSSWSGLHGYVRTRWRGADGSKVTVRGHIMDFVDQRPAAMLAAGVNFVHQSTTGMGHAITNGGSFDRTQGFEKLYFANLLVTSPAHASLTDHRPDYSTDLYTAHVPTLFNSVGSSNSETMAITKLAIAGAYLPPETKLLLKRNGLYAAALLYLWKAALPYDEPYAHELRHRIAYKAVGDRFAYSKIEKYGAAGIDRGDLSLPFHQYDDGAHMRAMTKLAQSMDVALPEALLSALSDEGTADGGYSLRKSIVVIQEPGKDVKLEVSTAGSYDLQGLPLTKRWKLLYGNKQATVTRSTEDPDEYVIRVPWDDALPEGRTAIALIANNGRFDSNPAIVTVYRKKADALPPPGLSPQQYRWPGTHANRRPVILGLQDTYVKRGRKLELPLRAVDPEGFPVAFHKRAGEVGAIEGSRFTWTAPKKAPKGDEHVVTFIASDGSGGSSYGGEALTIHVEKPAVLAQIAADRLTGKAPLTVKVSGKPSIGTKLKYGWDFYAPSHKRKAKAFKDLEQGREVEHTFEKPGVYEVLLSVEGAKGKDTESIRILVTAKEPEKRAAALEVIGNDVLIRAGAEKADPFDDTHFGSVAVGDQVVRTFRLVNRGDEPLKLAAKKRVEMGGEHAADFRVVGRPRITLEPRGSALLRVRFKPKEAGARSAQVVIRAGGKEYAFAVAGEAR